MVYVCFIGGFTVFGCGLFSQNTLLGLLGALIMALPIIRDFKKGK